jgi:hypothetical protein
MLPVYLKIFDEKLLFAQGVIEASQSIPLYTVFTGQAVLYFCLIEGDDRRKSWYRIVHPSGRREDEPFAEISVSCRNGAVTVALAPGGGTLRQVPDVGAEFARLYREGDYPGILGIDRSCKDPEVFERACETQKLVFSDEKDLQFTCDNAEHRLTAKYRPPSPPVQAPLKKPPEPAPHDISGTAVFAIAKGLSISIAILLVLMAVLCVFIVLYLYWTGGRPMIEIMR